MAIKRCFIILLSFFFIQCLKPDCEKSKERDVNNECVVVLEDGFYPSLSDPFLKPEGINPETGEYCKCKDPGRWWGRYRRYMEKGDTFVKRRGEDFFTIHKKDTVFRIEWGNCDEDNEYIVPKNNPPELDSTHKIEF